MGKTIGAIVAAFVVQYGGDYVLHGILLKSAYEAVPQYYRTDAGFMSHMWALILGELLFAIAAVLIYKRGAEKKPWVGQGIRFGILLALIGVAPNVLITYAVTPVNHRLALHWMIGDGIIAVLVGLVAAGICQPKDSAA
jgi:hypothetical protein